MKKAVICLIFCVFIAGCFISCTPSPSVFDEIIPDVPASVDEESVIVTVPSERVEEPQSPVIEEPDSLTETESKKEYAVYLSSNTNGLNVRSGAGKNYSILGTLDKGDMVKYVGEKDGWAETVYRQKTAYVYLKYVDVIYMEKADEDTEKVIDKGCELLGIRYVYGATRLHDGKGNLYKNFSSASFDCSSLMQYIFYYGKNALIDVNTRTQVKQGKEVAKSDIIRGDLLFFTNASRKNNTGIEKIGHVALYLGDNYILHTASDHAVIEKISALRWSYFITARRI